MKWEIPITEGETKEESIFKKIEGFFRSRNQELEEIVGNLDPIDQELYRKAVEKNVIGGMFEKGF